MARSEGSSTVPVVVVAEGDLAGAVCASALASEELDLLGVVPAMPEGGPRGVPVHATLASAVGRAHPVVLHVTDAPLEEAAASILEALGRGCPVVSTCAELAFPFLGHAELARRIDRAGQKAGVAVMGMGALPSLVTDRLPALLGHCVGHVRSVIVQRVVDLRTASAEVARRCGLGLTEEAFLAAADRGELGQRGLLESVALCALGLGIDCDDFEEELVPLLAEDAEPGRLEAGAVAGVRQVGLGLLEEVQRVRLELTLQWGAAAQDSIELDGERRLSLSIPGGIPLASAASLLVHAAPRVASAEAGLLTVLDLPAGR